MPASPDDRLIAAKIALGHEPSGIVLLRRIETLTDEFDAKRVRWGTECRYEVTAIERTPGGTSQATIADIIAELAATAKDERADRCSVVADISDSGAPFLRLLRDRHIKANAVVTGDAIRPRADRRLWVVPQREMISVMLGTMAEQRLQVSAELEHAGKLVEQLEAFATKTPPKDSLADWRPVAHVDLAQALMLATWWSHRMLKSIIEQPQPPRAPIEIRPPTFDEMVKAADRREAAFYRA